MIRSGEAPAIGWSRNMLHSGFNTLPRSVVRWQTGFAARISTTLCHLTSDAINYMDQLHTIRLVSLTGDDIDASFALSMDGRNCNIVCTFADNTLLATESDFFEALCKIRRKLEGLGFRPHCYGASLNAFPSAMSRDMGSGLSLYRTEIGQQGSRAQIAQTFETGEDVIPSTVEEQREHHKKWFESLGFEKS